MPDKDRIEEDGGPKWTVIHGTQAGNHMQTRFKRMPDSHLSKETVAGIRDMNLGRVKPDGSRVGAPIIRFDSGQNTGAHPHININPGGRRSANAPHIEVPEGVIRAADVVNRTLKYAGIGLTVCAVAIDAWRLGKAVTDDLYIREHADEIIIELEDSIKELKKLIKTESSSKRRQQIEETIEHLIKILRDVMMSKKTLPKTIKTTSSIAAGWGAGAAGAYACASAGAKVGAAACTCLGPAGPVVCAPVGATIGAIICGICAGKLGSQAGEYVADKALDTFVKP